MERNEVQIKPDCNVLYVVHLALEQCTDLYFQWKNIV